MLNVCSLRAKITISITILVLGITGALTSLSIVREREHYKHDLQQQAALFLDTVDVMLRNSLYSLKVNEVLKQVKQFKDHQTIIQSVHVFDKDGRLIIDSDQNYLELNKNFDSFGKQIIDDKNVKCQKPTLSWLYISELVCFIRSNEMENEEFILILEIILFYEQNMKSVLYEIHLLFKKSRIHIHMHV